MLKIFMPDFYCEELLEVDWSAFKQLGIKHVFLDIDNTLELQGAEKAGERTRKVCHAIREAGLDFSILSNAKEARAEKFCAADNLPYLGQAAKPLTFRMKQRLDKLGISEAEVLLVGDQIFTDLWAARFLDAKAMLVKSLGGKEGFFIRVKRGLEKILCLLGQDPRKAKEAPLVLQCKD